jgi:hypothetical protein
MDDDAQTTDAQGPSTLIVRVGTGGNSSSSQVENWMKALEWLVDTVHTENLPQDDPMGDKSPHSAVCTVM